MKDFLKVTKEVIIDSFVLYGKDLSSPVTLYAFTFPMFLCGLIFIN